MVLIVGCWQEAPQMARSGVASIRSSLHSLHKVVVLGAWPMTCLQDRLVGRGGSLELELTHRDRRLLNLNLKASMCFGGYFVLQAVLSSRSWMCFLASMAGREPRLISGACDIMSSFSKRRIQNIPLTQFQSFNVSKSLTEIGGLE
jgi:hypothetical protein